MSGLVEKLETAEVGSRELDVAIWAHLQPERVKVVEYWSCYQDPRLTSVSFTLPPKRTERVTTHEGGYLHARPVTTSLDAALALAERVLPDAKVIALSRTESAGWGAGVNGYVAYAPTPALVLCIAICRALNLNETRHD